MVEILLEAVGRVENPMECDELYVGYEASLLYRRSAQPFQLKTLEEHGQL
jgi:hypothetical protein